MASVKTITQRALTACLRVTRLSLLGVQRLLIFESLGRVRLGRQGEHAAHAHLQQVEALVVGERGVQRPAAPAVKEQARGRDSGTPRWRSTRKRKDT